MTSTALPVALPVQDPAIAFCGLFHR